MKTSLAFSRRFLAGLVLLPMLAVSSRAATIYFVDSNSATVQAGQSFTLQIYGETTTVDPGDPSGQANDGGGYDLYLTSTLPGNDLQLTSQTLNTTDFTYTSDGFNVTPQLPVYVSGGQSSGELGAFSNTENLPPGTPYLLSTDTFLVNASTPSSSYSVTAAAGPPSSDFFDANDNVENATISPFVINVVSTPEPTSRQLLLTGLVLFLGFGAYRRMTGGRMRPAQNRRTG